MLKHPASTVVGVLAAFATIYLISSVWYPSSFAKGNAMENNQDSLEAPISDLKVQFAQVPGAKPARVSIKISNTNPDHAITFLKWDTPLDPLALDTGVITLTNAATGETVPGPGLMLRRKMPPPREDLVEVPAKGYVSVELEVNKMWLPGDLKRAKVHAQGPWVAAWVSARDEVDDKKLEALGGERVLRGSFRSDSDTEIEL